MSHQDGGGAFGGEFAVNDGVHGTMVPEAVDEEEDTGATMDKGQSNQRKRPPPDG